MSESQAIIQRGRAILDAQVQDQGRSIPYRPHYAQITGSPTAAILLQQLYYWWVQSGRKPFYKFKEPCAHARYQPGDSWCEELAFSRSTFDSALKEIAVKITNGVSKSESLQHNLAIYWTDSNRLTWYQINETLLAAYIHLAYAEPDLLGKVGKSLYLDKVGNLLYIGNDGNPLYIGKDGNPLYLYSEITSEITSEMNTEIDPAAEAAADLNYPLSDWIDLIPKLTPDEWTAFRQRYTLDAAIQWCCYVLDPHRQPEAIKNPAGYLRRCCLDRNDPPPAHYADHEVETLLRRRRAPANRSPPLPPDDVLDDVPDGLPNDEGCPLADPDPLDPALHRLWQTALGELELQMTRAMFNTWVKPTRLLAWEGEQVTVGVPNGYTKDWLQNRLYTPIQRTLSGIAEAQVAVQFVVCEDDADEY